MGVAFINCHAHIIILIHEYWSISIAPCNVVFKHIWPSADILQVTVKNKVINSAVKGKRWSDTGIVHFWCNQWQNKLPNDWRNGQFRCKKTEPLPTAACHNHAAPPPAVSSTKGTRLLVPMVLETGAELHLWSPRAGYKHYPRTKETTEIITSN